MTSISSARGIAGSTKLLLAVGATLFTVATLQTAQAQSYEAYVTNDVNILSGPGDDYPAVAALYSGQPVTVYGCLDGYSWCDVQAADYRGWLDASVLVAAYEGRRVPLYDYGYDIGLPIVTFSFGDYWGHYYRDRPFFRDRERYERIPVPVFRGERGHFDHRPGFEQGRPGFERGPAEQGRQGFDRGQPQPQQGRPEFDRQHGPQFQPQQQQPQQRAAPEQRPQAPQPQFQPQAQQHMQGAPSHERYVGPGQAPQQHPQGGPPPQAPHPQAAPAVQRPAGPPPGGGQPHPQGQPHPDPRQDHPQ